MKKAKKLEPVENTLDDILNMNDGACGELNSMFSALLGREVDSHMSASDEFILFDASVEEDDIPLVVFEQGADKKWYLMYRDPKLELAKQPRRKSFWKPMTQKESEEWERKNK
jgi:hypothetical protein